MASRNIKNLRMIRALLANPDGSITQYRIAKIAGCSTAWAIEFLNKLKALKIVKKTKVLDIGKLIDFYIDAMPKSKYFEFYVQDPEKFLKEVNLDYALTTYGAENILSHHLFPSRYDIHIKEKDFEKWKSLIIKNGLLGKGNLRLIFTKDDMIFAESSKVKGLNIISVPQLLIDLKKEGGVCIEAYNILVKRYVQRH